MGIAPHELQEVEACPALLNLLFFLHWLIFLLYHKLKWFTCFRHSLEFFLSTAKTKFYRHRKFLGCLYCDARGFWLRVHFQLEREWLNPMLFSRLVWASPAHAYSRKSTHSIARICPNFQCFAHLTQQFSQRPSNPTCMKKYSSFCHNWHKYEYLDWAPFSSFFYPIFLSGFCRLLTYSRSTQNNTFWAGNILWWNLISEWDRRKTAVSLQVICPYSSSYHILVLS